MYTGDVADQSESTPVRYGRYLLPLKRRIALLALIVALLGLRYRSGEFGGWPFAVVVVMILALEVVARLIPMTVVSERGIHRLTGRYRDIPWSDVVGFLIVRTWRFERVEIQLVNGRNVTLLGVPAGALRDHDAGLIPEL